MKLIVVLSVSLLALLFIGSGLVEADVLYNNFGPGDTFDTTTAYRVANNVPFSSDLSPAMPFTVPLGTDYFFQSVEFAAAWINDIEPFPGKNFSMALMTDASNMPGSELESFLFIDAVSPFFPDGGGVVLSGTSTTNPVLTAGTQYWMMASAENGSEAGWNFTLPNITGPFGIYIDGIWEPYDDSILAAFRVTGEPVEPIPEPGTLLLLSTGLAGLAGYGYRFRRKRKV